MFKWYREWKKRELLKLQEELKAEEETKRPQFNRIVSEEAEKYRDSKEPWVTIVGETVTEDGIQLSLDWNAAFVNFLRAQGIAGTDETQVVQKWLAMIAKQTADNLGEGKLSEFE